MANLKDLRIRITSVKSTQKITAAMKMVAASKLRRAQVAAEEGRPYAERMERMLGQVTATMPEGSGAPKLLSGTGADKVHLLVVVTADRGLCGGFNSSIVRAARLKVLDLQAAGKTVKLLCVGRKGRDGLKREFESLIADTYEDVTRNGAQFDTAREVAAKISDMFEAGEFDICTLYFNTFKSAMSQVLTAQQLIPFAVPEADEAEDQAVGTNTLYIMEPSESEILEDLLPRNLSVQVFRALLEGYASEQGARMTAMDNATRNAGDMLDDLTMTYNRTRQAVITSELIEIISGAEAL
ncbi:MAG: F0F1 ATP synthase subunit gamma [Rhodospirillales bacterium]|jgi:F-type H+-transporting ATPase subunit gamma|nr:F0F1 ATP synthase subunit gamma [Rhodospirillales bacterium]MBT3907555.1 F0F1 ATP synthase subunit gamma [Rhodospirillaceae bacterium]MBT5036295.1 F0F1 ATP synthase subunit gamma [Rhodospirillaceae bacterium]MBT6219170.1 F0F1 ATP synthase subunit gamma [Rhodospirillaceae bacterium]MBT6363912.1 F0F1 ATP synthase subunit gamma [Rhodospirillaceae bacterium]